MTLAIVLMLATAGVCLLYLLTIAVRTVRKYRGPMVVTCPETQQPAAVSVDVGHAAVTASFDATELRLNQCSRWPEREGCGQECLRQIEVAPEDCLVRTMLEHWYADKTCALCGRAIGPIHSWDHRPGLLAADGRVMFCTDVPAEQLPAALAADRPLCWNCEVAEEFRQRNPELVVEAPRTQVHH